MRSASTRAIKTASRKDTVPAYGVVRRVREAMGEKDLGAGLVSPRQKEFRMEECLP